MRPLEVLATSLPTPTPAPAGSGMDAMDLLLSSGLAATILGLVAKWLHDRKKAPLEREAALSAASQQNVDSALAIAADARETVKVVKDQLTEDAKRERARHDREMTSMRARLTRIEEDNDTLSREVGDLKAADAAKTRELAYQSTRISRLQNNLLTAKQMVQHLLDYIKDHVPVTTATSEIPVVDFTIFDIEENPR